MVLDLNPRAGGDSKRTLLSFVDTATEALCVLVHKTIWFLMTKMLLVSVDTDAEVLCVLVQNVWFSVTKMTSVDTVCAVFKCQNCLTCVLGSALDLGNTRKHLWF